MERGRVLRRIPPPVLLPGVADPAPVFVPPRCRTCSPNGSRSAAAGGRRSPTRGGGDGCAAGAGGTQRAPRLLPPVPDRGPAAGQSRLLQTALDLPEPPRRIEGFDMSTTQGRETGGRDGRHGGGADDPRAVPPLPDPHVRRTAGRSGRHAGGRRRVRRLLDERKELPGLILVDGGEGQVAAAQDGLAAIDPAIRVPVAGLAKRHEAIYLPDRKNRFGSRTSPALKLLQQVRDEAHRFAATYHRHRRAEASFASPLDDIPGVGPRRKQALLNISILAAWHPPARRSWPRRWAAGPQPKSTRRSIQTRTDAWNKMLPTISLISRRASLPPGSPHQIRSPSSRTGWAWDRSAASRRPCPRRPAGESPPAAH